MVWLDQRGEARAEVFAGAAPADDVIREEANRCALDLKPDRDQFSPGFKSPVLEPTRSCRSVVRTFLAILGLCAWTGAVVAQTLTTTFDVYVSIDGERAPAWLSAAARMTGSLYVGSATDKIVVAGDRYQVESTGRGAKILSSVFDNLLLTRRSEGSWVAGGQATTKFYERRGSGEPSSAVFDYRSGTVRFLRGSGSSAKTEKVRFATSDTAALPYVLLGRPRPTGPVSISYTDGRSLKTATFDGTVVFNHVVAGTTIPTIRYVKRKASPNDPEIELWTRAEDGFPVRVRLGLGEKYGVRAEVNATSLPPPFKRST